MSGDEEQERLQREIEVLRGELGETVEALVHKVDVPARARERASAMKDEALERGAALKDEAADIAADVVERAREKAGEVRNSRWAMLAGAGVALLALAVLIRRGVRT